VDFCSRLRLTARIDPETRHFDLPVTPAFVLDQELFGINLDLCKQAKALIQHCLWNFREDWYRKTPFSSLGREVAISDKRLMWLPKNGVIGNFADRLPRPAE